MLSVVIGGGDVDDITVFCAETTSFCWFLLSRMKEADRYHIYTVIYVYICVCICIEVDFFEEGEGESDAVFCGERINGGFE